MAQNEPAIRDAATVVLVRDGCGGLEVLLAERARSMRFGPGMHVFPGGAVDAADRTLAAGTALGGLSAASACRALGVEAGGLAFWAAAIRECVEEAGILLASAAGRAVDAACIDAVRSSLAGGSDLAGACRDYKLTPLAERLHYLSHWITPPGAPRRFSTRFFIAAAPPGQAAAADGDEIKRCHWAAPAAALERHAAGELPMMVPTVKQLEFLSAFDSAAAAVAAVQALERVDTVAPGTVGEARAHRVRVP